jgi:O-acetyl-ADP-ribose deacetylase (regulator of RNase III)
MDIAYHTGDATRPVGRGNKIIAHVCNDQGRWGKGFVMAISARWPLPEEAYRKWFDEQSLRRSSWHCCRSRQPWQLL